jgi:hypothetical protein
MATGGEHNGGSESRLDRMERLMETLKTYHLEFEEEYRKLLKRLEDRKRGQGSEPS